MTGFRWLSLVAALMLWMPLDAAAQGRGHKSRAGNGGGPAFCRSGAGHPVHGWEWCRQKGWEPAGISPVPGTAVRRGQRDPYADRTGRRVNDVAFDNGYADGYEKGLDDGGDGRDLNPMRHAWYRSADRNYDSRYGSRAAYASMYREGFRSGYEQGYRDGQRYGDRSGSSRFPWPF
jgi:hypothetical protein